MKQEALRNNYCTINTNEWNESLRKLKAFYNSNFSPAVARFHVVGNIDQAKAMEQINDLNWESKEVEIASYNEPSNENGGKLFFIDLNLLFNKWLENSC